MDSMDSIDNPRMVIRESNLERTFAFLEILEDKRTDEKVNNILGLLGDCFPSGTKKDVWGASFKQVEFIASLANFDPVQAREFCRVVNEAGGLDSAQASHLINALKASRNISSRL